MTMFELNEAGDNPVAAYLTAMPQDWECEFLSEFMHTFGASLDMAMWAGFVKSEAEELLESYEARDLDNCLKEICDIRYTMIGMFLASPHGGLDIINRDIHSVFKDLAVASKALSKVLKGNDFMFNIDDLEEAFMLVHESNMTKLDDDGNPILKDGKVQKGPNYTPPDLKHVVDQALDRLLTAILSLSDDEFSERRIGEFI